MKTVRVKSILVCGAVLSAILLVSTGCLKTESGSSDSSSTGPSDMSFAGISAAENVDGSTIKVSWALSTNVAVLRYRIYEVMADGTLTAVGQVNSPSTSYYHTGLTAKTYHTYRVNAVNAANEIDNNIVEKSAFTYPGITSATATGSTTVTVNFPAAGPSQSGAKVYATARGTTTLVATATNSDTSANITGLKSGTTYTFSVKAFDALNIADTNLVTYNTQTTVTWTSRYQGPILVQAYGDSPNAPTGTPQSRQVEITWAAFTSATSSTSYSLVRVASGNSVDLTTNTACTSALSASCRVCTATGDVAKTCTDTNVGAPPAKYDYIVTLNQDAWPEESPTAGDTQYRITVPIPPDNMVLVQRDSVNYEFCQSLGRTSDPTNHQRCSISGISMLGATPYNVGPGRGSLGLSNLYYDFGYNLFVDRWEAACNWTPNTGGGMCGASATAGDCFGTGTPVGTVGVDGNVYYRTDLGECFVKQSGSWINANNTSVTAASRALITTIAPSTTAHKPPLTGIGQNSSYASCQAITDPDYGSKRLLRQREWRAAAAWQNLTGEPNALTDGQISTYESGSSGATTHTTLGYCNSSNHTGLGAAAFNTTELAGDVGDVIRSFTIGSNGTKNCVSRYGAQDMAGNVREWVSDNLSCNATTASCSGTQSTNDSGNGYASGFDMNGFAFDSSTGPGGIDTSACAETSLTGQTDPPAPGAGSVGQTATSTTNVCYYKRDATTWVNYASATVAERTRMHGITGWTIGNGAAGGTTSATGYGATYFNYSLGLPMMTSNNSNSISVTSSKLHSDYFDLWINRAGNTPSRGLLVGGTWNFGTGSGRWASNWSYAPSNTSNAIGFRCALPAE